MTPEHIINNKFPRIRAHVVSLEHELEGLEKSISDFTVGTNPSDPGLYNRAMLLVYDKRDELSELRELLAAWEEMQENDGRITIPFNATITAIFIFIAFAVIASAYVIGLN